MVIHCSAMLITKHSQDTSNIVRSVLVAKLWRFPESFAQNCVLTTSLRTEINVNNRNYTKHVISLMQMKGHGRPALPWTEGLIFLRVYHYIQFVKLRCYKFCDHFLGASIFGVQNVLLPILGFLAFLRQHMVHHTQNERCV